MDDSGVVSLTGVSKRFFRRAGIRSVLAELLDREAPGAFWALRDVDLVVGRGERVGVVGSNGAGKTTLLRVLSGVTSPTRGRRRARGRVLALSEMQACLHRELTGRENIPLLAALAGLERGVAEARFGEILAFAGLPTEVLDTPVKNYSNGMATRMAIAVATVAEPDLVVVDEGFAAGDLRFRRQCFDRLGELASRGGTFVLATHEVTEVWRHCDRCLHLQEGRLVQDGTPDRVLAEYQGESSGPGRLEALGGGPPSVAMDLQLSRPGSGGIGSDDPLELELRFKTAATMEGVVFGVQILAADGGPVYLFRSPEGPRAWTLGSGPGLASLRVPCIRLAPGAYGTRVSAWNRSLERRLKEVAGPVIVVDGARCAGAGPVVAPVHEWTLR